jgi:MFS family permease
MTAPERQRWFLVASLFVTLFLLFGGGYNTGSLFFPQLVKHFGWTHARTATLTSVLALSAGLGGPLIGMLLDRIEARIVMATGVLLTGGAFLIASRANSFPVMLFAYIILGFGIAGATLLPASLIIANWFGAQRGFAMGLTFAGTSLGGAGMTLIGAFAVDHLGGWRSAYVTLALPMLLIALPLVLWRVRSRPPEPSTPEVGKEHAGPITDSIPGLELNEALHTRSFWMLCTLNFMYGCVGAGAGLHLITYLINLGYSPKYAASMMSLTFVFASIGKLGMGIVSDRASARVTLAINFVGIAVGLSLLFGVASSAVLLLFVVVFGLMLGAPLVLIPLLAAESMGLKRFGSIGGTAGIFQTLGAAVGPVVAGQIFDLFSSYNPAFEAFIVLAIVGAVAALACLTLEVEQARLAPVEVATA